jgi:aspartyl-tRNA(Asn)/glutamyl-tRNA(Gln) amidotransferase subunit B
MEIVSEPEISSPEEAFAYLSSLRQILVYGDLSDADMEKGQLRCDVNVSVRKRPEEPLGPKIELKNLNSISGVRRALRYEIDRQIEALESGESLEQSTRRWDDDLGQTFLMRTKEHAHDYRYFPDPDLLPLETAQLLDVARKRVPELPHAKRERFQRGYGVSSYDAGVLASDRALADFFESAAQGTSKAKGIANWIINDLLSALNTSGETLSDCRVRPEHIRDLTALTESGAVSVAQAREVFALMFESGRDPGSIVREKGMEQVSDAGALEPLVDQVLAENPSVVADVQSGNERSLNFLTGQIMKLSRGKANPRKVAELLRARLF